MLKIYKMKKAISTTITLIIAIITIFATPCFSEEIISDQNTFYWNNSIISQLDIPGKNWYDFTWIDDIVMTLKNILARAIEYIPMIVLIVLFLACFKIIFQWDWKDWLKRIKYILIWVALMILSVYIVNILSTIFFGHPVLNIHLNRWY